MAIYYQGGEAKFGAVRSIQTFLGRLMMESVKFGEKNFAILIGLGDY